MEGGLGRRECTAESTPKRGRQVRSETRRHPKVVRQTGGILVDVQPCAPNELSEYCIDACHSHTPSDDFDHTDIMYLYDIASVASAMHKWYTNQVALFIRKHNLARQPTACERMDCGAPLEVYRIRDGVASWRCTMRKPHTTV